MNRAIVFEITWGWLETMQWLLDWRGYGELHLECVEQFGPSEVPN